MLVASLWMSKRSVLRAMAANSRASGSTGSSARSGHCSATTSMVRFIPESKPARTAASGAVPPRAACAAKTEKTRNSPKPKKRPSVPGPVYVRPYGGNGGAPSRLGSGSGSGSMNAGPVGVHVLQTRGRGRLPTPAGMVGRVQLRVGMSVRALACVAGRRCRDAGRASSMAARQAAGRARREDLVGGTRSLAINVAEHA